MKIWIGGKLGVRDWIDVVLAVNSLSIVAPPFHCQIYLLVVNSPKRIRSVRR